MSFHVAVTDENALYIEFAAHGIRALLVLESNPAESSWALVTNRTPDSEIAESDYVAPETLDLIRTYLRGWLDA